MRSYFDGYDPHFGYALSILSWQIGYTPPGKFSGKAAMEKVLADLDKRDGHEPRNDHPLE